MEQILVELEVKLDRLIRDAKIIMWLSIISIINPPIFLIPLIHFLIYNSKLSKLKHIQSLSSIFNNLNAKTTKELKSIQMHSEPLEQRVASLLLAHKSMVLALIVVGIIVAIIIGVIGISYQLGLDVV